jgi:pimeloyl-ACP methyl ester carboxylesterase
MQEGIRGSRLAVIPAAGHVSNVEGPDEFNAQLRAFLGALPHA